MSNKKTTEASSSGKSTPKDAQVMVAILKDMGVTEYEPRVINQMLEFTYRYVTDVLDDAKIYSSHANKKNIDIEDIKLAIQCRLDHSFTTPPPRDLLMDVARHKNNNALPLIKPYTGTKLPPDRYCLANANYKLKAVKKPRIQIQSGGIASSLVAGSRITIPSGARKGITTTLTSALTGSRPTVNVSTLSGSGLSIVNRGVSQPTVTIRSAQATSAPTMPVIRVNPGSISTSIAHAPTISTNIISSITSESLKRKREPGDDDDYDQM